MGLINKKISINAPIRYRPKNKRELQANILELLKQGITDFNCIDVSEITDMNNLFVEINDIIGIPDIDISEWNVSNVTDMTCMFYECTGFNSDLSKWDVSNVKKMTGMFFEAVEFNSDISNWDVSNVTDMSHMFDGCESMTYDLSKWNTTKVKSMAMMFDGCSKLIQNNKIPAWKWWS